MAARLVVSLSGVSARMLDRCAELSAELTRRGVPLSLLFAPGFAEPETVDWLRGRQSRGDALLLHGFNHAAEPRGRTIALGRKAEFAALPAHEANLRLTAAIAALERVGLVADGFAPPRWLVSPGTLIALRHKGFALCADVTGVRDLRRGTVHRGRVQGFGRGDRTEPWWCYALVLGAARQARKGGLVRLAADAMDLVRSGSRQALLDAVDIALHHGAGGVTYPEVITPRQARAA
ncbi:MAG TPA: DUF2334 domain-containing protein [Actinophytocola sp.]|uniref:DUF2334 domain-containing protein n=1 Tax=Actinophytocola sp. TaxID=1872138 RepID=UPI002DDD7DA5|nr:DUF2334 domain-containing protein [Actinophytocola sp.]HEV2783417.1 DUF2334 domain-containing protein [Actinophytocola sp.]